MYPLTYTSRKPTMHVCLASVFLDDRALACDARRATECFTLSLPCGSYEVPFTRSLCVSRLPAIFVLREAEGASEKAEFV